MTDVYVVTNAELGWDCVVGVFNLNSVSEEQLEEVFPAEQYYIVNIQTVHKDLEDFK